MLTSYEVDVLAQPINKCNYAIISICSDGQVCNSIHTAFIKHFIGRGQWLQQTLGFLCANLCSLTMCTISYVCMAVSLHTSPVPPFAQTRHHTIQPHVASKRRTMMLRKQFLTQNFIFRHDDRDFFTLQGATDQTILHAE